MVNIDLGSIIWVNASKKLLSYHKWFFTPFNMIPLEVQIEFRRHKHTHPSVKIIIHHSHTHTNAVITSGGNDSDHYPQYTSSDDCKTGTGALPHQHEVDALPATLHTHTLTISFAAANLGSPNWWVHVHAMSGTCGSGGSAHSHTLDIIDAICAERVVNCPSGKTPHYHTHTLTSANGGAAHTDHSISGNTANANIGTPESHTHNFSFTTGVGGAHAHTVNGTIDNNCTACDGGYCHYHNRPATTVTATHNHSASGVSGSGGEPLPTGEARGDGFYFLDTG